MGVLLAVDTTAPLIGIWRHIRSQWIDPESIIGDLTLTIPEIVVVKRHVQCTGLLVYGYILWIYA